jgi:hypothetical protein
MPKTSFKSMNRAEWEKPVSRSSMSRRDAFVDAIKSGDPVSDINGKDVYIANTSKNIDALDTYLKSPPLARGKDYFMFDLKGGGTILSSEIGKSPLFGGQGAGGGATGDTARFESLHCLYIAALIGEGTRNEFSHFTYETLEKYKNKVKVSEPFNDYVSIDGSWHESSYEIAKALIKAGYATKQHTLHRGDSVMDAIYKAKDRVRKLEGKPALNSDKWNPGDIWAVKSGINPKSLFANVKTLNELNTLILKHFKDRTIVGISLKKVNRNKRVKLSDYNLEETILDKHKFSRFTLETAAGKGIWTSKYAFLYFDGNKKADVRAPNLFSAINFELQGSGARAGRTGYGQIMYSSGLHLKKILPTNKEITAEAKLLAQGNPPKKIIDKFFNLVKSIHPNTNRAEFESNVLSKKGQGHFIHALLGAAYIGSAIMSANRTQRDKFTSELVNVMAAKTNDSSAYVKAEAA